MESLIRKNLIGMFLILLSVTSCGSASLSILKLRDRRLIICKEKVGLCWPHKVCTKKHWYSKEKCIWKDGFLDFNDKDTRQKLIDMGFTATTPDRFKVGR